MFIFRVFMINIETKVLIKERNNIIYITCNHYIVVYFKTNVITIGFCLLVVFSKFYNRYRN